MKRRFMAILSAILCVAVIFTGCGKSDTKKVNEDKKKEQIEIDKTEEMKKMLASDENLVAVVGDVGVTKADYNLMYKLNLGDVTQYEAYGEGWYNMEIDDDGTTIGNHLKSMTMDSIVEIIAVTKLAKENGVKVNEDINAEVNEQIKNLKEYYGGEEGYNEFLDEYRTTDEAIRTYFERAALYNRLIEKLSAEGGAAYIKDKDILSEFAKNYMRVQHILISTQEGRSEEDALAIANEVIKKLDQGADFDSLITEYNEDPGMTAGNYYIFTSGEMVAEFEEESKNLAVGEYSKKPVKTDYGYHIVKKYNVVAEGEEFESFKQQKSQEKISELIEKKIDSLKVEKKDDVIDEIIENWMKDLGVDTSAKPSTEGIQ